MNTKKNITVAINASGITDSIRSIEIKGEASTARIIHLSDAFDGAIGIMAQIADAGAVMEKYRDQRGPTVKWGGELPCIYDVWDAIARALLERLGEEPVGRIVLDAIESAVIADTQSLDRRS